MMKDTWKGIGVVVVLTSLFVASVIPLVMAGGEEQISCTVTTGVYSVTLVPASVNYGAMLAADNETSETINATNNGGIPEDLYIYGSNATGPGATPPTWTLGGAAGADIYRHTFNTGSGETSLTTSNQVLANDIAADAYQNFTLKLYTPITINTHGEYTFSVTVVATAP